MGLCGQLVKVGFCILKVSGLVVESSVELCVGKFVLRIQMLVKQGKCSFELVFFVEEFGGHLFSFFLLLFQMMCYLDSLGGFFMLLENFDLCTLDVLVGIFKVFGSVQCV